MAEASTSTKPIDIVRPTRAHTALALSGSKHHSVLFGDALSSSPREQHDAPLPLPDRQLSASPGLGRVVNSGWLYKRNRAKQWSRRWFVLRDYQLVYYKDEHEYKVEGIIPTAEILTVAMVADPHRPNRIVLYTSKANVHLRADNAPDAQNWCDVIRQTADEAVESTLSSSFKRMSVLDNNKGEPFTMRTVKPRSPLEPHEPLEGISFPKNFEMPPPVPPGMASPLSGTHSFTDDMVSSWASDQALSRSAGSSSGAHAAAPVGTAAATTTAAPAAAAASAPVSSATAGAATKAAQQHHQPHATSPLVTSPPTAYTHTHAPPQHRSSTCDFEDEKIVKKGYLLRLRRRYNQWKRKWVVLTTHRVLFYKSQKHGTPLKIIDMHDIIDVADIDPLSKSKKFCFQIITAHKRLRFCCESEEDLTSWLASLVTIVRKHQKSDDSNDFITSPPA
ncbi:hypothetical protein TRVA0_008S02806 [Trichomonascus vanleenenianus]|uniref:PH domain-containing protein n=1 Tax=Trichomonascus vanleenenianus TaxID=2268995 RepID=UPI003ECAB882